MAALASAAAAARAAVPARRLLAMGWSTVEMERAERDFEASFHDADADAWLGARCRVASDAFEVALVLLEPSTEGRLAGSLARLGEGPVVVWYVLEPGEPAPPGRPSLGPFGPETPLTRHPTDARFRFLVRTRTGTMLT